MHAFIGTKIKVGNVSFGITATIAAKHNPLITVGAGDRIRFGDVVAGMKSGTGDAIAEIDILLPSAVFAHSPEPSETGVVQCVITQKFTALFAADIGVNMEDALLVRKINLRANILEAPFPGLGTAAGNTFVRAIAPQTIIITPDVKNAASAPTKAILAYLASSTALSMKAAIISSKPGVFLLYNKEA